MSSQICLVQEGKYVVVLGTTHEFAYDIKARKKGIAITECIYGEPLIKGQMKFGEKIDEMPVKMLEKLSVFPKPGEPINQADPIEGVDVRLDGESLWCIQLPSKSAFWLTSIWKSEVVQWQTTYLVLTKNEYEVEAHYF